MADGYIVWLEPKISGKSNDLSVNRQSVSCFFLKIAFKKFLFHTNQREAEFFLLNLLSSLKINKK